MTNITILIIGALLSISILYLVRKGKMHGPYATWWLLVAVCAIVLSIFPKIIDWAAAQVGITYPPTLLFVLSVSLILGFFVCVRKHALRAKSFLQFPLVDWNGRISTIGKTPRRPFLGF